MSDPAVSIIITNHNYARFVRTAIDSALAQETSEPCEVIVVDDGSSDESRAVIESYDDRALSIFKENAGQASAVNAGFARSRGDVVILLDADDVLLPTAARSACEALRNSDAVKVHWPMHVIDESGADMRRLIPNATLPYGSLRDEVAANGPHMCEAPPTSGNAWRRSFLQRVLPIPEADFRLCADAYLLTMAAVRGLVARVDEPQSCYRMHQENHYWHKPFDETIRRAVAVYEKQCRVAADALASAGIPFDATGWRRHSWWHRLAEAVNDINRLVAPGQSFVLVDDDIFGTPDELEGRVRIPFPQVGGAYAGPPASDEAAVAHLRALRRRHGADWIIFAWPCWWYLESYPEFAAYLQDQAACIECEDRLLAFHFHERLG